MNLKLINLKLLTLLGLTGITTPFYGGSEFNDVNAMMVVSKYFDGYQDFFNLLKLCKDFKGIAESFY